MANEEVNVQATLQDEALEELGLSEQPFIDDKKRTRFSDSTSQKVRATLEQHLRFGESLHLFVGEQGAGKTVFLSQLIKHCKTSIKPFVAKGAENFETVAFLAAVLNQLGGEQTESTSDHVDALVPLFEKLAEEQMSVVLAIDDAHLAPIEEIAELIDVMPAFASADKKSARLLLTGEPRLSDELAAIADEFEGLTLEHATTTLYPLDEPRIREYLTTRLNQAGHTDLLPFTDKAISKIHRESGGLPANVNMLAAKYLNAVYAGGSVGGKGFLAALGWPLLAMGAAAVGLIVWGISLFFGGSGGDTPNNQVVVESQPVVTETIVAETDIGTELIIEEPDTKVMADSNSTPLQPITPSENPIIADASNSGTAPVSDLEDDGLVRPADLGTEIAETDTDDLANAAKTEISSAINAPAANTATPELQPTTEQTEAIASTEEIIEPISKPVAEPESPVASDNNNNNSIASADTDGVDVPLTSGAAAPAAVEVPLSVAVPIDNPASVTPEQVVPNATPDPISVAVETVQTPNLANNGVAVKIEPLAAVTNPAALQSPPSGANSSGANGVEVPLNAAAEPAVNRAIENERWVLFQEPTSFTVQLATSRERDYIIGLAQSLDAEDPVAIYPFLTTNSNNPVFGLLSGLYTTRTQAIQAVEQMDAGTKQFGVWIRPISDLQAAIKKQP